MLVVSKDRLLKIYDYFLIYFAVAVSGNPFFVYRSTIRNFIILVALIIVRGIVANTGFMNKFTRREVILFFFIILWLSVVMLINGDNSLNSYLNPIGRLAGACLLTKVFVFSDFSKKYVNLLTFLAVVSVVLFFTNQATPQIANFFGNFPNATLKLDSLEYRTYVNGSFLYTFLVSYGYGTEEIWAYTRNNGIFWEPGAYQFFLNLALVLLFEKCQDDERKGLKFIILVITVLSTGSSTGMLALVVIIITYHRQIGEMFEDAIGKYRGVLIIAIGAGVIFLIQYGSYLFYAADKIVREIGNSGYILERIGLSHLDELFTGFHFIVGHGVTGVTYLEAAATLNNTYSYYMFAFGIPYMLVIMCNYFSSYKRVFTHYVGAFIVLLMGLSSEVFMLYPIALTMLFWDDMYVYEDSIENTNVDSNNTGVY